MNFEKIEQLIKLVKENDVKKFKYKDYENEIELDFTENDANHITSNQAEKNDSNKIDNAKNEENDSTNEHTYQQIKSQMVGTFFLQDSKELTDPIIQVGDNIKSGDVIGYVEAMKVMNEVTSDIDGEITDIVIEHGTNVEYDQVLVKVK